MPRRGTCRYDLAQFRQTQALPSVELTGARDCRVHMWEQGEQITVDLPIDRMIENIGSKVDGAGMCVMTSITQGGIYQRVAGVENLRDWCAKLPGGGYPEKVEQQIRQYFKEKGLPEPGYLQYTGPDPEGLLDLIDKTGRTACVASTPTCTTQPICAARAG